MICDGCSDEILEAQHYIKMTVELATRMPDGWEPVRDVEPTVLKLDLHGPGCFIFWADSSPTIQDVFAR